MVKVLNVARHWRCPKCSREHVTRRADVHTPMHPCPSLNGLDVPFLEDGVKGTIVAVEREDYVGKEVGVRKDNDGRVFMAAHTIREDGFDCFVFPGQAKAISS